MPLIKMERYTLQQRIEIIKIHYKNGENMAETIRQTQTFLGLREAPCRTAIEKLVENFELSGEVGDVNENELVSDDGSSITGPTTKKRKTQNNEINLPEAPTDEPHPLLQNKNNKEKQPVGGKKRAGRPKK